jgi:peptidoglycan/LPS O-acetylase OafA/YrhL
VHGLLLAVWVAALLVQVMPFLRWHNSPVAGWLLQLLAFLPVGLLFAAAYLMFLSLAPKSEAASKNVAYLPRLDHLRFFAATLVIQYHFFHGRVGLDYSTDHLLLNLFNHGSYGVDLFFVLSGFIFGVIGAGRQLDYRGFLRSRLLRIYPLYIVAIVIVLAAGGTQMGAFDRTLLLLPFLTVPTLSVLPGFGHLWTIGLEFQFYLVFPFLNEFINRHGVRLLLGLVGLLIALRLYLHWQAGSSRDLAHWSMLGRFDEFALGLAAARLHLSRAAWFRNPLHTVTAIAGVLLMFKWSVNWGGFYNGSSSAMWTVWTTVQGLVWGYLILAYLNLSWKLPAWFDGNLQRLGQLSFSLYVFHSIAMTLATRLLEGHVPAGEVTVVAAATGLLVCMPVAILVALPIYEFVEKPFLGLRSGYARTSEGGAAAPRAA